MTDESAAGLEGPVVEPSQKQRLFLAGVEVTGNIGAAARHAGVHRTTHGWWMHHDPTYPPRFAEAMSEAMDRLELEARRRAEQGTSRPIFHQGVQVGEEMIYSDRLMEILLKAHKPELFRDRLDVKVNADALTSRIDAELAGFMAAHEPGPAESVGEAPEPR